MKMTNYEADVHLQELNNLQTLSVKIPATVGYRILQNIHALSLALEPFHKAVDNAIRSHSGGAESINQDKDPAAFEACAREITELRQIDIEVPVHMICISQIENVELPVNALFALDFMLEKE